MMDNESSWWVSNILMFILNVKMKMAQGPKTLMKKSIKEAIEWLRLRFGDDATQWRWERLHRVCVGMKF